MADSDIHFLVAKRKRERERCFIVPGDELLLVHVIFGINDHVCKSTDGPEE